MKANTVWLECTEDIVPQFRQACRLIQPTALATSDYPLLYNLMYVPFYKFQELDKRWIYQQAQRQHAFVNSRMSIVTKGWGATLNPYMDAPMRANLENDQTLNTDCLAKLLMSQAIGKTANGSVIKLFNKIQCLEFAPTELVFQTTKPHAALAKTWIDTHLPSKLAQWFADDPNGNESHLSRADVGVPARKLSAGFTGDAASAVQTDNYLRMANTMTATYVEVGTKRPNINNSKRTQGTMSWSNIVAEQRNSIADFPQLPIPTVGLTDPPPPTRPNYQQLPMSYNFAAPTLATESDTSTIERSTQNPPTDLAGTVLTRLGALEKANAQIRSDMTSLSDTIRKELEVFKTQMIEEITASRKETMRGIFAVMTEQLKTAQIHQDSKIDEIGRILSLSTNQMYNPILPSQVEINVEIAIASVQERLDKRIVQAEKVGLVVGSHSPL